MKFISVLLLLVTAFCLAGFRLADSIRLIDGPSAGPARSVSAQVPTTVTDFQMPGSQPNQSGTLNPPGQCGCHDGYSIATEPAFNWRGGMMSQAARDPLFYAAMTIANQDAAFAGDLCIRCHSPKAWLEGRSTPTDASALTTDDREGVFCDFCHRSIKPAALGVNPYPAESLYTANVYSVDQAYLATLTGIPPASADGMYIVDSDNNTRRGPFADANPNHAFHYSPFHKEAAICGTCHNVSNPVFQRVIDGEGNSTYTLTALNTAAPSSNPYDLFPVERTYGEWSVSAYNTTGGVYAPQFGGNKSYVSTCQDCHMRDITGKGCNKRGAPERTNLPHHDMTGGNTWVPKLIETFFPGESNAAALDSGISRATSMLRNAATMEVTDEGLTLAVKIINQTGHKLPSGYPEGRRIWINVKAMDGSKNLLQEFGAYNTATGVLTTGTTKVYEAKLGMSPDIESATGLSNDADGSSFHFAVNNKVVKDNRIPPRGFTNAAFRSIQSEPVAYSYPDSQYWDVTSFTLPAGTVWYEVRLYYQTTSKEYIEFLRDNNTTDTWGTRLDSMWKATNRCPPVLMAEYIADTPLPIQSGVVETYLIDGAVELRWKTYTETNNYGFYVERRGPGQPEYMLLEGSFIPGQGTTLSETEYTWTDATATVAGEYSYRLRQIDLDGRMHFGEPVSITVTATGVRPEDGKPDRFELFPVFPLPFNPSATIRFAVPHETRVTLTIYDMSGRIVESLLSDRPFSTGIHEIVWYAGNRASGIYYIGIEAVAEGKTPFRATGKMLLMK